MKIVVIHGDDIKSSRERFNTIVKGVKKKGWSVNTLSSKDNIESKLTSLSIFDTQDLYVIDDISDFSQKDLDWIIKNEKKFTSQLLIFSKKPILKTLLKKLNDAKIEEFTLPKNLFNFIDSLYPGNSTLAIKLFENLMKEKQPLELLISLMAKQFRDMLWILSGGEGLTYPEWRKKKLRTQANKYSIIELENIITCLSDIDYKSKTSDINTQLLVEMLIVENL